MFLFVLVSIIITSFVGLYSKVDNPHVYIAIATALEGIALPELLFFFFFATILLYRHSLRILSVYGGAIMDLEMLLHCTLLL